MLYVQFFAEFFLKGTSNVLLGGGGQRSMVKDQIFTFFLGPFPNWIIF